MHSSFSYSPIAPVIESTLSLLLETYLNKITLCWSLRKDAADSQGNMVKEDEEGNASVEE